MIVCIVIIMVEIIDMIWIASVIFIALVWSMLEYGSCEPTRAPTIRNVPMAQEHSERIATYKRVENPRQGFEGARLLQEDSVV